MAPPSILTSPEFLQDRCLSHINALLDITSPQNNKIKLGDTLPCIILSKLEFTTKFNFVTWTNSACLAMESLSTSNRNGTTKTDNFSKPRPSTASSGDWQVNTPGHPHWPLYRIHNVYGYTKGTLRPLISDRLKHWCHKQGN